MGAMTLAIAPEVRGADRALLGRMMDPMGC